jgi:adenylate kinase family enzyme
LKNTLNKIAILKKIAIVGSSCSGKTTLSKVLEKQLKIKRIELDAINWQPDWQELDYDEFTKIVDEETRAESWVVDGNYQSRVKGLTLKRADTIIWLNLPFSTVYRRLFSRLYDRIIIGEELWNGNRESFWRTLFDKDSLLYWIPRRYWITRRGYRKFFANPLYENKVLEFQDADALALWLKSLPENS